MKPHKNKAMEGAKRKGREAAVAGKRRSANPYGDVRADYNNSVTFSRAFRRMWFEGYDSWSPPLQDGSGKAGGRGE